VSCFYQGGALELHRIVGTHRPDLLGEPMTAAVLRAATGLELEDGDAMTPEFNARVDLALTARSHRGGQGG